MSAKERFVPAALTYRLGPLCLGSELEQVDAVARVSAHEAVILYCARILEGTLLTAIQHLGFKPDFSAFGNLLVLEQCGLLDPDVGPFAHALRRLGNEARHLHRVISPQDAHLGRTFLEPVLSWFFCRFPAGPGLPSFRLGGDHRPKLGALGSEGGEMATEASALWCAIHAENLLDEGNHDQALVFLNLATRRHPFSLRLQQLEALGFSRAGLFERAITLLEPLQETQPDDETAGILAGAYKRRWQAEAQERRWLKASHDIYLQQWNRSRANTYLGINAATTALWLNRPEEARRRAGAVHDRLAAQEEAIRKLPVDWGAKLRFWDQVTLAEACLLMGNRGSARERYRCAFLDGLPGDIAVAELQARRIEAWLDGLPQGISTMT